MLWLVPLLCLFCELAQRLPKMDDSNAFCRWIFGFCCWFLAAVHMRQRDESRLYVLDKEGSGHVMEAGARCKGPSFAPWVKKMRGEEGVGG